MGIDPNNHRLNHSLPRPAHKNPENSASTASTSSLMNNQLVSDAGSYMEDKSPSGLATLPNLNLDLSMGFPSSSSLGVNEDEDKEKKLNIQPNLSQQQELVAPSAAATLVLFR